MMKLTLKQLYFTIFKHRKISRKIRSNKYIFINYKNKLHSKNDLPSVLTTASNKDEVYEWNIKEVQHRNNDLPSQLIITISNITLLHQLTTFKNLYLYKKYNEGYRYHGYTKILEINFKFMKFIYGICLEKLKHELNT